MKKKALLFAAILGLGSSVFAQRVTTMKNDKGLEILPEAGDWAIQMSATPLLDYIGNAFNGTSNNSLNTEYVLDQVIVGKYYRDAQTAFRAKLGISLGGTRTDMGGVPTAGGDPTFLKTTSNSTNVTLGLGIEKRKGYNRLQGFYGAEAFININSSNVKQELDTEDATSISSVIIMNGSYTTENKSGLQFGLGVRGFIGADYFILPKLAIGAEFGWGIGFVTNPKGEVTTKAADMTETSADTYGGGSLPGGFRVGTDNGSNSNNNGVGGLFGTTGNLTLTLHF